MLGFLALLVACHALAAQLAVGWVTAAGTDVLATIYLFALALRPRWRAVVVRLFLLGLVAGVFELFTDFSGERVAHSLVYPAGEPMLWTSPVYMPLSWAIVLTQLGYFAWRLRALLPASRVWLAMLLSGLAGAAIVPFYEEMAYYAGWWHYAHAPVLAHTPYYVLLFEGLIAAALPPLLGALTARSYRHAALLGALVGLWMPCAALIAWLAIGR